MRPVAAVLLGFAVGCAPPPLSGSGAPSIELLYPAPATVVTPGPENVVTVDENGTNHMALDADGILRFTAVVAFHNIEFVEPSGDPVNGQAHWHLFVEPHPDSYYVAPHDLFYEAAVDKLSPDHDGTVHTIRVRLQQNDHSEMACLDDGTCTESDVEQRLEFALDPPSTDTGSGS